MIPDMVYEEDCQEGGYNLGNTFWVAIDCVQCSWESIYL